MADLPEEFTRRWFHPNLTGKDAEDLLRTKGKRGSFLVRPSTQCPGDFTLSVRRESEIIHIRIQSTDEFYDLYGGETFATLAELIQYYTENQGTLKETNGEVINLLQPVYTEQVTLERWYHGGVSGKESELLLLQKGFPGSFLVRASFHTPGSFVLSTRLDESTVLHIKILCKDGKYDVGKDGPKFDSLEALVNYYRQNHIIDTSGNVVRLKQPVNATRIISSSIHERIEDLKKTGQGMAHGKAGFWEEFEQLQQHEHKNLYSRKEGAKAENRAKNRFKNILPFDHTRVILRDSDGGDYVNANYLKLSQSDSNEKARFVATQGALPATVTDFWRMVFQEGTGIIVMTTNETERGRVKCHCYWPQEQCEQTYGRITVKNLVECVHPHYVLREFLIHRAPGPEEQPTPPRPVYHFHFKAWPDHGVPQDTMQVLGFLGDVNRRQRELEESGYNPGPIVVHCSAGIGRTGTFIVIDFLLNKIDKQGMDSEIDIQHTILSLRQQRSGMVQTEAQYKFIYMAVSKYISMAREGTLIPSPQQPMASSVLPVAGRSVPPLPGSGNGVDSAYANLSYIQNGDNGCPPPIPARRRP